MLVIERDNGIPVPSPAVMERLRVIDPVLDLKPFRFGDNGIEWALTHEWPENDPRRARIQSGELAPSAAQDIICFIPLRVAVDEIPAFVEKGLTAMYAGNQRGYIEGMLARIRRENQKAPAERWAKVEDKALEMFETMAPKASSDVIRLPSAGVPDTVSIPAKDRQKRAGKSNSKSKGNSAGVSP